MSASSLDWVFRDADRLGFKPITAIDDLLKALTISKHGQIIIRDRGLRSVEPFYLSRNQTIERLFYQHTVRAADLMLEFVFSELREQGVDFQELVGMDEFEFLSASLQLAKDYNSNVAVDLLTKYKSRTLHKRLLSIGRNEIGTPSWLERSNKGFNQRVRHAIAHFCRTPVEEGSLLIDIGYPRVGPDLMVMKDGHMKSASALSPSFEALRSWPGDQGVTIYVSPDLKKQLESRMQDLNDVIVHAIRQALDEG